MKTARAGGSQNQGCQSGKSDYMYILKCNIPIIAATPQTLSQLEERMENIGLPPLSDETGNCNCESWKVRSFNFFQIINPTRLGVNMVNPWS